jgi:hypothetical protein
MVKVLQRMEGVQTSRREQCPLWSRNWRHLANRFAELGNNCSLFGVVEQLKLFQRAVSRRYLSFPFFSLSTSDNAVQLFFYAVNKSPFTLGAIGCQSIIGTQPQVCTALST